MTLSPTQTQSTKQRFVFIDTLRGLSAVSVILFHMIFLSEPILDPPRIFSFFLSGGVGVTMFFLISAYSLSMTMPRHLETGHGYTSFYIHRTCRILPLFYVVLLITLYFFISRGVHFSFFQVFLNILCFFNFFPGQQESIVMAGWTIGVEMLFYAIFPFIYKYLNTITRLVMLFIVSLFCSFSLQLFFGSENYLQYSIIRHFPIFMWGMILFKIAQPINSINRYRVPLSFILILTAVYSYNYLAYLPHWHGMNYYFQLIPFSCLFLGLLLYPLPVLVSPITAFLGTISYSLYLLHPLVIVLIRSEFPRLAMLNLGQTMTFTLYSMVTLSVLVPLAYLFFMYVEKPGMLLGKWFMAHHFAVPSPSVAAPQEIAKMSQGFTKLEGK